MKIFDIGRRLIKFQDENYKKIESIVGDWYSATDYNKEKIDSSHILEFANKKLVVDTSANLCNNVDSGVTNKYFLERARNIILYILAKQDVLKTDILVTYTKYMDRQKVISTLQGNYHFSWEGKHKNIIIDNVNLVLQPFHLLFNYLSHQELDEKMLNERYLVIDIGSQTKIFYVIQLRYENGLDYAVYFEKIDNTGMYYIAEQINSILPGNFSETEILSRIENETFEIYGTDFQNEYNEILSKDIQKTQKIIERIQNQYPCNAIIFGGGGSVPYGCKNPIFAGIQGLDWYSKF